MSSIPPSGPRGGKVEPVPPAAKVGDRASHQPSEQDQQKHYGETPENVTVFSNNRDVYEHLFSIFRASSYAIQDIERKMTVPRELYERVLASSDVTEEEKNEVRWWQEYQGILIRQRNKVKQGMETNPPDSTPPQSE